MKRIVILSLLAVFLILAPSLAKADQTTGKVTLGVEAMDMDDSKEGAGEYRHLDQGGELTLEAEVDGWQRGVKYDANFSIFNDDEIEGGVSLDVKRYFRTNNKYQRFIHWLENDDLVNWNDDPDFSFPDTMGPGGTDLYYVAIGNKGIMCHPELLGANVAVAQHDSWGKDLYIIRQEFTSHNEFLIPGAEFIKIHADYRREERRGYEQGRTMNKCSGCHFYAEDRRVNEATDDFKIGATAHLGMLTVDYTYFYREFKDKASHPENTYTVASNSHGMADQKIIWDQADGDIAYDATPKSKKYSNIVKAQLALPMHTSVFGTYVNTTVENKTATDHNYNYDNGMYEVSDDPEYDYDRVAFRLTSAFMKNLTISARYSYENLDNDTVGVDYDDAAFDTVHGSGSGTVDPALYGLNGYSQEHDGFPFERESSLSRETNTYGLDLKYRLFSRTSLLLGYEREEVDRDEDELNETDTDTFKVAVNSRYFKNVSMRVKYQYQNIDDPFEHKDAAVADAQAISDWLSAEAAGNPACPGSAYSKLHLGFPWVGDSTEYFVMYNSREATLTSEPEDTHEVAVNLTWNISPKLSANFHYKYRLEKVEMDIPGFSDSYDKEMHSPGIDLWFAPTDRLTFTLAYQYQKMEDEAFLSIPAYGG
jgi:hypothetical protein